MSSFLKELLNETRKINEEDLFSDGEASPEAPAEIPAAEEMPAEEPIEDGCPVTDELVAELTAANPAISEVDPAEFKAGLECECDILDAVGGDWNIVASLVLAKLNEFPGKDYYGAVKTMEASLMEPEAEEVPAEGGEVEAPAFNEEEGIVEEGKDGVGDNPTTGKKQPDTKAMSQVKNESAVGTDVAKAPGKDTTAEEKKDEKDAAADMKHTKAQAEKHKATDKADMDKNDMKEAAASAVGTQVAQKLPGNGTTAEEKGVEGEEKGTWSKEAGQAAQHKAVDQTTMTKKDVNPIKVTPRA